MYIKGRPASRNRQRVELSAYNGALAFALLAVLFTAYLATPARAQSQGPNSPSSVVDDPSIGVVAWNAPQVAAIADMDPAIAIVAFGGASPSHYLKATGFGFSIPAGAVVNGIEVSVALFGVEVADSAVRIVKGGTIGATDRSMGLWPANIGFMPPTIYGGNADLWGETWTAADINAADFGFAVSIQNAPAGTGFVDGISITVFYTSPLCGDGFVNDVGEQCDDGNTANGDCCSATCQLDPAGYPCADNTVCDGDETCDGAGVCQPGTALDCDDNNLCTQDSCDPISGCVNGLHGGCRTALKSILILKDKSPDTKDKLVWKWVKGQATGQNDFGVPTGTTQYALCIHSGAASTLLASYNVPADAMKWSAIGTKGYKYTDPNGGAAGITKVLLKGGAPNKAKCLVKGKGSNLADFDLTTLVDPVTVQLVNSANSTCFESTFQQADFITSNDAAQFKAKAQ